MFRVEGLFALSGGVLVALGIVLKRVAPHSGWAVAKTAFNLDTPCYALAALFCLFAFLYSIGYLMIPRAAAHWHLGLSWAGMILFAMGCLPFQVAMRQAASATLSDQNSAVPLLPGLGFFLGPLVFLLGQGIFAVVLIPAVLRARHLFEH